MSTRKDIKRLLELGSISRTEVIMIDNSLEFPLPSHLDPITFTIESSRDHRIPELINLMKIDSKDNTPLDEEEISLLNTNRDKLERLKIATSSLSYCGTELLRDLTIEDKEVTIDVSDNTIDKSIPYVLDMEDEHVKHRLDKEPLPNLTLGDYENDELTVEKFITWNRNGIYLSAIDELQTKDVTEPFSREAHDVLRFMTFESSTLVIEYFNSLVKILPEEINLFNITY